MICAVSRSVPYMAYVAHVVTGVWCGEVCADCVYISSGIVFKPSPGAITDRSQSAKDTDPYFKSQLCVEDPDHRKPLLILPNGLSKPRERAHDRNFNFCRG